MRPKRTMAIRTSLACLLAGALRAWGDEEQAGIVEAFANGRPILELRPRYNFIEQSSKPLASEGITYRIVAGWQTARWSDLRLTFEAIGTGHIGPKNYNDSGANSATSPYPLLPDPAHTGVNQAFIEYTGFDAARVKAGRQVIRLDNQRFISDNDFRQVPNLFDAVGIATTPFENTELYAGYSWRMRTSSGAESNLNLTMLHAAWNPAPGHGLAAYAYLHDQPQNGTFTGFANNSHRTIGIRAEGAFAGVAPFDLVYTAELADQQPYAGGDYRIDARYWRLGGGAATDRWTLRYDYEMRGSNEGLYALQTPFANFYAFNGWTLHFFNMPRQGLHDRWLTARYQLGPFILYGEEHRFKSDFGNLDFGEETDVGITWRPMENLSLRLRNAHYRPGTALPPHPKITKTWFTVTYVY